MTYPASSPLLKTITPDVELAIFVSQISTLSPGTIIMSPNFTDQGYSFQVYP